MGIVMDKDWRWLGPERKNRSDAEKDKMSVDNLKFRPEVVTIRRIFRESVYRARARKVCVTCKGDCGQC
jgi:hypothetical protein